MKRLILLAFLLVFIALAAYLYTKTGKTIVKQQAEFVTESDQQIKELRKSVDQINKTLEHQKKQLDQLRPGK